MTVGVNISHDASICIKKEDSIEFFEESRFNKKKHWEPTKENFNYLSFKKIKNFNDNFVFSFYGKEDDDNEKIIENICEKHKIKNFIYNKFEHHLYHACSGFHISPFDKAVCIIMDGGGANLKNKITYTETDSIYYLTRKKILKVFKTYSCTRHSPLCSNFKNKKKFVKIIENLKNNSNNDSILDNFFEGDNKSLYRLTSDYTPGLLFNHLCTTINMRTKITDDTRTVWVAEPGKAMGLSSYGNNSGERDEDLAKQVQEATKDFTINLIEKALTHCDTRNVVLSGGYALNCVNNFKYTEYFKNVNFFIDPCPHDGGTSLGAAVWYDHYR
jgi:carbamoyltransferase